jgi:hypothetical protein
LGVGMPSPWRVKALRSDGQVVPTLGGGIHAAELFGQRQGAFGLGPLGQEPAGLPAQRSVEVPPTSLAAGSCWRHCGQAVRCGAAEQGIQGLGGVA